MSKRELTAERDDQIYVPAIKAYKLIVVQYWSTGTVTWRYR